jgi:hypothetical protein
MNVLRPQLLVVGAALLASGGPTTFACGGAIASIGTGWIFRCHCGAGSDDVTGCGACWPSAMQPRG